MKNRNLKYPKLCTLLEKSILIIFLFIIFSSLQVFVNLSKILNNNKRIESIEKNITENKHRLENIKKGSSNEYSNKLINYDLWLRECASVANICIYENTNELKILSEKSQMELDEISKQFKIVKDNRDYNKIVKFIIIDKRKNTFLTNDVENIEDIEYIKSKVNDFSEENGNLFNYISSIGKWYHISYNIESTPAYIIKNTQISIEPNNFVQAYWFPKDYTYSEEVENLLNDIIDKGIQTYQKEIDYGNQTINSIKVNVYRKQVNIVIYFLLLMLMILILYLMGKDTIVKSIKNTFIFKFCCRVNKWFENKSTLLKGSIFIFFTITVVVMFLYIVSKSINILSVMFIFFVILYLTFTFPKFVKFSKYIDEIIKGINIITSDNLEHVIEEKGDIRLKVLAHNINILNKGFKVSIEDQIKNEKLKSELVANVSHDLKTPLTSIINYTDILLREDISEDEKEEFLKILNRKSLKLKSLIEDLFEISKMNSGKVQLEKSNVDVVELINQSIAEYSDTEVYIYKNLNFVIKSFDSKIEMNLDGNRMSRVFENLINNALKYSLKDTRVYVEIEDITKGIKISLKNISAIPLDFDKKEIFERFTRGDKARNSEVDGSGLGLAIAKSIVELHDGIMYIDFDGDLFKVMIELYY